MPSGRLTTYNSAVADQICELIVQGYTIREISDLPQMPDKSTIFLWLSRQPAFADQYARAKEFRADDMADEIVEIADDGRNDWMERKARDGAIETVPDNEAINRSRLRVDTRKWLMGKLRPKVYGDKMQHEHRLDTDPVAVPYADLQAIVQGRGKPLTIEHDATAPQQITDASDAANE